MAASSSAGTSQNQMRFPPVQPSSEGGYGFLRNFDSFLVTCGLDYTARRAGSPAISPSARIARCATCPSMARSPRRRPALAGYGLDAEAGLIWCEGVVRQSGVFGDVLERRRRIELGIAGRTITIRDRVTNAGFNPAPHALLYHFNFGYPLLDVSTVLTGAFGDFADTLCRAAASAAARQTRDRQSSRPSAGRQW